MNLYIVTWQGRPMRAAAPSTLRVNEHGRLFTSTGTATVWKTRREAAKAMRTSIEAWSGSTATPIGDEHNWEVVRLARVVFARVKK